VTEPALELRSISKHYGSFTAVDSVSFVLPRGGICGFLGPNGAGKTTLLRVVLDILHPTSGSLSILGADSAFKVRDRIGYLPEEKGLYRKMKAWAIIAYFATLKGMSRRAARERAFELLERYGLKDFAEARSEALSKGMGQKVQVLAAIAHDPELVILDEPFSGLDPVNQNVMEEVIGDLARRGRTVIFSTHVMQHAERMCDRIFLISRGKKIFDGTLSEARRTIPRMVRIESDDAVDALSRVEGVLQLRRVEEGPRPGMWELETGEQADPQAILRACFDAGIRLRSFDHSEASLHEVFMHLVGDEAGEVVLR